MGTGRPDPSMDPTLVQKLLVTCGRGGGNATATLDQGTSLSFDGSFYREVTGREEYWRSIGSWVPGYFTYGFKIREGGIEV
ncbi:Peroxidase 57 [Linum grandiflorum]